MFIQRKFLKQRFSEETSLKIIFVLTDEHFQDFIAMSCNTYNSDKVTYFYYDKRYFITRLG